LRGGEWEVELWGKAKIPLSSLRTERTLRRVARFSLGRWAGVEVLGLSLSDRLRMTMFSCTKLQIDVQILGDLKVAATKAW
jgi:hypothetical protein